MKSRKILFLAANPRDTTPIRLDEEVREVHAGLRRSKFGRRFKLEQRWAVRPRDLRQALLEVEPNIIHFSGHGGSDGALVLEDPNGISHKVQPPALAELFHLCRNGMECVILNACYSELQAESIADAIGYVIGMRAPISDKASIEFSVGFYDALGAGRSISEAFDFGCNAIRLAGLAGSEVPVLKHGSENPMEPANDIAAESEVRLVVVLSATIDELDVTSVQAIVRHLRDLATDVTITIDEMAAGSVRLFLRGSSAGLRRLHALFNTDNLAAVAGYPVEHIEFEDTPAAWEPKLPCVLVLDASASMGGEPIARLNSAVTEFRNELLEDRTARRSVEVAIIPYSDSAFVYQDFCTVDEMPLPQLNTGGSTSTGAAVDLALELITRRKAQYRDAGIEYFRPWICLVTDGHPTDDWRPAAERLRIEQELHRVLAVTVAVGDTDLGILSEFMPPDRPPLQLSGLRFEDMFRWLSMSMRTISQSREQAKVTLPPINWAD